MLRIGIDTGGTFTDLVWMEGPRRCSHKLLSTPDDPSLAVLEGLRTVLERPRQAPPGAKEAAAGEGKVVLPPGSAVVHGTTVATNALLQGQGAPVALLATEGFEDLLEIGRQNRPALYDPAILPAPPLVPRRRRYGIPGRMGPGGEEEKPLDLEAVERAVRAALKAGSQRIAICFLHSYAQPAHETAAGRLVDRLGGEAILSCRVLPEYREYERTSTTVVSATLQPVMSHYLGRLEAALPGTRLSVFRSNGGVLSARAAAQEPVQTLLSGPAAGVVGAWRWGLQMGLQELVTLDMGGTSTDVALLKGAPAWTTEAVIGGYPVRLPLIDIHTVGAGGGSLVCRDSGGALVVGPGSAGADPGPACYGRGGDRPTVTDAHLVLGRLPEDSLLGGRQRLDRQRAAEVLTRLGGELGLGLLEVAAGVVRVANAGMERAVRVVSVQRGYDPREGALFCFGGAGGLHAAELAFGLGMREVVIPPDAGVFSALGMLMAPLVKDAAQGFLTPLERMPREQRDRIAHRLEERLLADLEAEGYAKSMVTFERSLDLRYRGQSFELNVPEGADPAAAYHQLHVRRFAHERPGVALELVAIRVRCLGPAASGAEREVGPQASPSSSTPIDGSSPGTSPAHHTQVAVGKGQGTPWVNPGAGPIPPSGPECAARKRQVCFQAGMRETSIHARADLPVGRSLDGPCIITETGSTTLVPPGWRLRVDVSGNLRLTRDAVP